MSLIKYLNNRNLFFAYVLPSILPCAQISSESQVKVFPDETLLIGEIYAFPTVAPPESPIPAPLPLFPPHGIRIVIGRLPPFLDAIAKSVTEALVSDKAPLRSSRTIR